MIFTFHLNIIGATKTRLLKGAPCILCVCLESLKKTRRLEDLVVDGM